MSSRVISPIYWSPFCGHLITSYPWTLIFFFWTHTCEKLTRDSLIYDSYEVGRSGHIKQLCKNITQTCNQTTLCWLIQIVQACWMWSPSKIYRRMFSTHWSSILKWTTRTPSIFLPKSYRRWLTWGRSCPTMFTSFSCSKSPRSTCVYIHCCRRSWRTCISVWISLY